MKHSRGGLSCVIGAALTVSCSSTTATQPFLPPLVETPVVAVVKVSTENIARRIELTGEFKPYQVVDLHAKVAGFLRTIGVDVGDRVASGQALATLEVPEMKDDIAQASASIKRAQAELSHAQQDVQRTIANLKIAELSYSRLSAVAKSEPGLIAQHELDEALSKKQSAEAQVATAKGAVAVAEEQITVLRAGEKRTRTMSDYLQIVAPFSGVITKRFVDPGAMIQAGTNSQTIPVVRLAQMDRLRLVLPVPESSVPSIQQGAAVSIHITALNKDFAGSVSRISRDVQLSTRTMDIEVDVSNTGGALAPGMYATATLTLERHDGAVTVPAQAVTSRDGKRYVLMVNGGGVIEERLVKLGIETATKMEVLEGLAKDDLVVVGNRSQLKTGQKVEPKAGGID